MKGFFPFRAILSLVLIGLALLSFQRVPVETQAFGLSLSEEGAQMRHLQGQGDPHSLPWSVRGRTDLMLACLRAQNAPTLGLFPRSWRLPLHEKCRGFASDLREGWPSFSLAHLVHVQASSALGEVTDLPAALDQARMFAPYEGWQAGWRVTIAMRAGTPEPFAENDGFLDDIAMLAGGGHVNGTLIGLYRTRQNWRQLIVSGVERAPLLDQRNFLSQVKAANAVRQAGE